MPIVEACHFINDGSDPFDYDEFAQSAVAIKNSDSPVSPLFSHEVTSRDIRTRYITPISPVSALSNLPFRIDPRYSHLVSYYCERLCPLTVPSRQRASPFYSLILPFCNSASNTVSDALLALSARHLSRSDSTWAVTAARLENVVLRDLRHRLATAKPSEIWQDHELPVVMMLMCLYEILNRCDQRWVVHLRGARDLIRARRNMTGRHSSEQDPINELTRFAERFFAFQDVIGRTACGETPIFGSDYWSTNDETIDGWLGCSPALVSIICSVTELSRLKNAAFNATVSNGFAIQAADLESKLMDIRQSVPSGADDDLLLRSAEIKRSASRIHLYCALYGATPRTHVIKEGVRQVLRQAAHFLHEDVAAGLVWPLFVAAVELDPLDDEVWKDSKTGSPVYGRAFVLRMLEHMGRASIANVTRTRGVICKIWDARDAAMTGDDSSVTACLSKPGMDDDWDRFVAPLSSNISLA